MKTNRKSNRIDFPDLTALGVRLEFAVHTHRGTERMKHWQASSVLTETAKLIDALNQGLCQKPLPDHTLVIAAGDCRIAVSTVTKTRGEGWLLLTTFRVLEGKLPAAALSVTLNFSKWSKENYVLLPGAVYAGNRFESRKIGYPPLLENPADIGPEKPEIVADIPRLNLGAGPSRIQQVTRDLATPAVGVWNPQTQSGLWTYCPVATRFGEIGIDLIENEARDRATLSFQSPCVREQFAYRIGDTQGQPSPDQPRDLKKGMVLNLPLWLHVSAAASVPEFVTEFAANREKYSASQTNRCELPFSAAAQLVAEKTDRENWDQNLGLYFTDNTNQNAQSWQMGWVGGAMVTLPMLASDGPLRLGRAWRNLDFIFSQGISPSGFFKGTLAQGVWRDDGFGKTSAGSRRWHLLRKSADGLYFLLRHFDFLIAVQPEIEIPKFWEIGVRGCADAFVRLWKKYGQLGQFVDENTGDIIVGRSASAAITPAGLALAARYFEHPEYLRVAEAMARYLRDNYLTRGYTNGGPGEILQSPDSESCFGLLEGAVALHEATGASEWLDMAGAAADLCATWVVSYNYRFPRASTFGSMDMPTVGTVLANAQNKHAAPGICTLSGESLLKLYRATGRLRYLELLRDIARALPFFVSRADRPITAPGGNLPPGWINERVNISDWLEPVGEIFYGSCWPEVSLLLTHLQVPGIYVRPDIGLLMVLDHVEAQWPAKGNRDQLVVINPTDFPAEVKVMCDKCPASRVVNPADWLRVSVAAHQSVTIQLNTVDGSHSPDLKTRKTRLTTADLFQ
jgi:hypothetical protein